MLYGTLCLDSELYIIAISTVDNPDPFDLLGRKGCDLLLRISNQAQPTNPTAIGEGDVLAIRLKLPTRLFVFQRTVIMLKFGIAFLAWLVCFAVLIEAGDSKPR